MKNEVHSELNRAEVIQLTIPMLSQDWVKLNAYIQENFDEDVPTGVRNVLYYGLAALKADAQTVSYSKLKLKVAEKIEALIHSNIMSEGQVASYRFDNATLRCDNQRMNLIINGLRAENQQYAATIKSLQEKEVQD